MRSNEENRQNNLQQVYIDAANRSEIPERVIDAFILLQNKELLDRNREQIAQHPFVGSVARAISIIDAFGLLNQPNLENIVFPYAATLFDYWLEGLWIKVPQPGQVQNPWLTQARLDALCQPPQSEIRDRAYRTLLNIPEVFACMTSCSGDYEQHYGPYYRPFLTEKFEALVERKASFRPQTPGEVFDISSQEAELYYHFVHYFIHHPEHSTSEMEFLLDIPAIRRLAPRGEINSSPIHNSLLHAASYIRNQPAVEFLLRIPEVRQLAEHPLPSTRRIGTVRFFPDASPRSIEEEDTSPSLRGSPDR
ncbi:hypothetical protein [Legionella impletisoli]|uniref:Uncharacterized protein n=1 Tax=Legionella impletisoli TaxID=343510 RepID=A0A917JRL0_9GAMM|nr:hypothetical protein [Legionella impletisoli]GGI78251.1 hypothetical protein GCM10007966_03690 [Legionella impletisoli]